MESVDIKGNSGCKIELEDGRVVKSSKAKRDNARLKIQCQKQKAFKSDIFKAPKVYNSGEKNEKFFFEMEFVPYKTFNKIFSLATKKDLDNISNKIISFIESNIKGSDLISKDIIVSKFEKTLEDVRVKKGIDLSYLSELFYSLDDYIELPIGYCHGDLTFSNLLFEKDDIVLIDFLDTYFDSPIQDIIKVKQDTEYFWSLRMLKCNYDKIKMIQCFRYIDKVLEEKFNSFDYYRDYYKVLQVLNLMRIISYCDDKKDIDFLLLGINKLCQH